MIEPESIHQGIAFEESTGTFAVVLSHVVIGRYGTYARALRALEEGHGSELAVAEEVTA